MRARYRPGQLYYSHRPVARYKLKVISLHLIINIKFTEEYLLFNFWKHLAYMHQRRGLQIGFEAAVSTEIQIQQYL